MLAGTCMVLQHAAVCVEAETGCPLSLDVCTPGVLRSDIDLANIWSCTHYDISDLSYFWMLAPCTVANGLTCWCSSPPVSKKVENKLARLKAAQVRNYDRLSDRWQVWGKFQPYFLPNMQCTWSLRIFLPASCPVLCFHNFLSSFLANLKKCGQKTIVF